MKVLKQRHKGTRKSELAFLQFTLTADSVGLSRQTEIIMRRLENGVNLIIPNPKHRKAFNL